MNGSKYTTQLAVGLAAVGFLLIVLGWNGAPSPDRVPGQLPYLISGGVAGLGLVMVGLLLALVQELRRNSAMMMAKLDEMGERIAAAGATGTGPTAVPTDGSAVIAGRTTYHLPDCNLVEGRGDLQPMGGQAAVDRGLAPCRICEPEARQVG